MVEVFENYADWRAGADRHVAEGPLMISLPIPDHFTTSEFLGSTPNHAAAVLLRDGRTLHSSQPFSRAQPGSYATSHFLFPDTDLYGDGIAGSHGGSGLSALGGTIRLGELTPGSRIPHALKMVLPGRWYTYRRDESPGYRWPAQNADSHASVLTYQHDVEGLEMGALLALQPNFNLAQVQTEPARIIARALKEYGAYTCDTAGWNAFYFSTEWSPNGRVIEEFQRVWGFPFVMEDLTHP